MRCQDVCLRLSTGEMYRRTVPISDSCGRIVFTCGENGTLTMTEDSRIPCLASSQLRNIPRYRPSTLGGLHPLANRELAHVIDGLDFRTSIRGSDISDRIVFDALWRSAPHGYVGLRLSEFNSEHYV